MSLSRCYLLVLGGLIAGSGDAFALETGAGSGTFNCSTKEVRICTLGLPPACHCEPQKISENEVRGTNGRTGPSGANNSNIGNSRH